MSYEMDKPEAIDLGEVRVERFLDQLEVASYFWAGDVNLERMVEYATSPMRLNRNAPPDVVTSFHDRMKEQVSNLILMAFVEGAFRAFETRQDAIRDIRRQRDEALTKYLEAFPEGVRP